MATEKTKVVVIHGSHKSIVDGTKVHHRTGDAVELSKRELLELDPQFRNGMGERFATPEKAQKLNLKKQLEAELDGDEDAADDLEEAADEAEERANGADEGDEPEVDEAAPTPPSAPAVKAKKNGKKSKA